MTSPHRNIKKIGAKEEKKDRRLNIDIFHKFQETHLARCQPQLLHNVHMVKFSCNVNNFSSETTNSFVGLKEAEKPTSDYILPIIQKMDHREKSYGLN